MHRLREHRWDERQLEESTKLQGALPVERAQAGKHKPGQHRFGEHRLRGTGSGEHRLQRSTDLGAPFVGSTDWDKSVALSLIHI